MQVKLGKKIMIVGLSGSGKTTLARKLGGTLGLPVIHLDKEFWNAGWIETPRDEWRAKQQEMIKQPEWIMDGNFGGSMEIRLAEADTVIFLDYNRFVCLYGVIKRWAVNYGKTRPDMTEGCPEKIDFAFLKWIWQYPTKWRARDMEKIAEHKGLIIVKNRKQLNKLF